MTIVLHTGEYASEYEWSVAHGPGCFMPSNVQYEDSSVYTYDCCAELGPTTVTCVDSWGDGWQGGYLVVDGVEYCKGFPGFKSETELLVPGTYAPTPATTSISTTTPAIVLTSSGCKCLKEWSIRGGGGTDNYCANPDDDPNGTWCFTIQEAACDREWDYCTVPSFPTNDPTPEPTELFIPIGGLSTTTPPTCSSRETLLRVVLQTEEAFPEEISWFITEECKSDSNTAYESNLQYVHFCCLEDGVYTLSCRDSWEDGWHGGYMSIGGETYCESDFGAEERVDLAVGNAVLPEEPFEPTGFTSFTCEDPATARLCMSAEISGETIDPSCDGLNENGYIAESECDEECIFNKCANNEDCGGYIRIGGGFVMSPLDIAVGQTYPCEVKSPPCGMEEVSIIISAQNAASRFAWFLDDSCQKAGSYSDGEMYVRSCCLPAGSYELDCATEGSMGYLQINGESYCDNASNERSSVTFGNVDSTNAPSTTQPVDCVNYEVVVNPDGYPEEMAFEVQGAVGGCAVDYGSLEGLQEPTLLGECCFPVASVVTLVCQDAYGDGWAYGGRQGSIQIGDITYCEDYSDGYYSEPIAIEVAGSSTSMPESSDAPSSTMPESSDAPSSTMPESSEAPSSTMPESSDAPSSTMPESSEAPSSTMPESSEAPSSTMPESSDAPSSTMPESSDAPSSTMPEDTEDACVDFATSGAEAIALGDAGCLVAFSPADWGPSEYCGRWDWQTCSDILFGPAYSTCCPKFCGLCDNVETSMDEEPFDESMDEDCVNYDIMTHPDGYPEEMHWNLVGLQCGLLAGELNINMGVLTTTCCVPTGTDITIRCGDQYGDGWAYDGMQGYLSIDGETFCGDFNTGFEMEDVWTVAIPPTEAPQTTEEVCVNDPEFTNNRGQNCEDIGEKLIRLRKKCETTALFTNCCRMCEDVETRTTEEIEIVDMICPGGYTLNPTATFIDVEGFETSCEFPNRICNFEGCPASTEDMHNRFMNTDCCREDRPPSVMPTMTPSGDCVDVLISIVPDGYPGEMSWSLSEDCVSNPFDQTDPSSLDVVCCLPDGEEMELSCFDTFGDGWGISFSNPEESIGYVLINGEKYCDSFIGSVEPTHAHVDTVVIAATDFSTSSTTAPSAEDSMDSYESMDGSMGDFVCEGVDLEIFIFVDNFPAEMGISILESDNCQILPGQMSMPQQWYSTICCLPEMDTYTLQCSDTYADGWYHNGVQGYVVINDNAYCSEFSGGNLLEVTVDMTDVDESMGESSTTTSEPTVMPTASDSEESMDDFICEDGIEVDVMMLVDSWPGEMSWSIAEVPDCARAEGTLLFTQEPVYTLCCLPEGEPLTLTCSDSFGDGWQTSAFLEISGVRYCDDFSSGFEKTETVTIGRAESTPEPTPEPTIMVTTAEPTNMPTATEETTTAQPSISVCSDECVDSDWTNNRGETCDDIYEKYSESGRTCSNAQRNNCCCTCEQLESTPEPTPEPTMMVTTAEPTNMPTATETTSEPTPDPTMRVTTAEPTIMPTATDTTAMEYVQPDAGILDSMERLLKRPYTEQRLISVAQRATNLLQAKNENDEKVAPSYDPIIQDALRKMRRFWKNDQTDESYWTKMINQYNNIAEVLGRESL